MTDNNEPTRETVEASIAEAKQAERDARKGEQKALDAFAAARTNAETDTSALLDLAKAIETAKAATAKATAAVSAAEKQLEVIEFREKAADLFAFNATVQENVKGIITGIITVASDVIDKYGISRIVLDIGALKSEQGVTCSVRSTGEHIPTAPSGAAPRARSTDGTPGQGGARARYTYTTPAGALTSRQVVEQYGPQVLTGNVTAEMVLAEPTKHGLTHKADAIAKKLGFSKVEAPASA